MKNLILIRNTFRKPVVMLGLFLFTLNANVVYGNEGESTGNLVADKKPYLAKVGDEILMYEDFMGVVSKLHQSSYVGEKLSTSKSFEKINFSTFLDDKIDEMLIVHESKKLGLNKKLRFKRYYNVELLNLCLAELRNEEIVSKVKVSKKEIINYFLKEKLKDEKKLYKVTKERLQKEGTDEAKLMLKELKIPTKKQMMVDLDQHTYKAIEDGFRDLKEKEVEAKFFKKVFKSSGVKINKKLLKSINSDNYKELGFEVLAEIHGEPIIVSSIVKRLNVKDLNDYSVKYDAVKKLITYKQMDYMALNRSYEKLPHIKKKLEAFENLLIVKSFTEMIATEKVKVTDDDIARYYKNNKNNFIRPSNVHVNLMLVKSHSDALKVVKQLKKGAKFSVLADTYSEDSKANKKGGDMGWLSTARFPEKIKDLLELSKSGDIVGPVEDSGFFVIAQVKNIKKGVLRPFESVKREIDRIIGSKLMEEIYNKYLEDLRNTVPIDIDYSQLGVETEEPSDSKEGVARD